MAKSGTNKDEESNDLRIKQQLETVKLNIKNLTSQNKSIHINIIKLDGKITYSEKYIPQYMQCDKRETKTDMYLCERMRYSHNKTLIRCRNQKEELVQQSESLTSQIHKLEKTRTSLKQRLKKLQNKWSKS
ncbi:hypothetical protein RF11_01591 [Thelohanellus kitauei]|uniref:Uncharacterized protein n=1 Tax=Thelohanellus kitauei TaxID=669202 RepID=A0A0C2J1I4_THEKT|nr:hypothetical protein RF11_01591 [Thelohanellus kitauei]